MNCLESYLVELLQGHITYNNSPVEVVRQFSNSPNVPVITLDLSAGVTTENYFRAIDEPKEKLYFIRKATININTWCNTEEERESINAQVMDCYYKSLNHHYRYCSRYDDGLCSTTNRTCEAINSSTGRGVKKQCPNPDVNKYQCLSDKHELLFGTVVIEPPFFLDEVHEHPPLLRSVFRAESDYIELVSSMGEVAEGYEWTEE